MKTIKHTIRAAVEWRWFIPVWGAAWWALVIGPGLYFSAINGWVRDFELILGGAFIGLALSGAQIGRFRKQLDQLKSEVEAATMSDEEACEFMRREMVRAGEEAIAELRSRHPDIKFSTSEDDGVRH